MKKITRRIAGAAASAGVAMTMLLAGATSASALPGGPQIPLTINTPNYGCGASWIAYQTTLTFQCDGNLVLYQNGNHHALWASGTYKGGYIPNTLNFSRAGYIGLWWNNTTDVCYVGYNNPAPGGRVVVQDDGNLVIYNTGGQAVWASGTYGLQQGNTNFCYS